MKINKFKCCSIEYILRQPLEAEVIYQPDDPDGLTTRIQLKDFPDTYGEGSNELEALEHLGTNMCPNVTKVMSKTKLYKTILSRVRSAKWECPYGFKITNVGANEVFL